MQKQLLLCSVLFSLALSVRGCEQAGNAVEGTACTPNGGECECGIDGPTFLECVNKNCSCPEGSLWNRIGNIGVHQCGLLHGSACVKNDDTAQPCFVSFGDCYPNEVEPVGKGKPPQDPVDGTCLCHNEETGAVEGTNSGIEYYEEANLCIDNLAYLTKECSDQGGFKACYPFARSTCLFAQDEATFKCLCTEGLELNEEQDDCVAIAATTAATTTTSGGGGENGCEQAGEAEEGIACTEDGGECECGIDGPTFLECVNKKCTCPEGSLWNRIGDSGNYQCGLLHGSKCMKNKEQAQPCFVSFGECYADEVEPSTNGKPPKDPVNGTCLCHNEESGAVEGTNSGIEYYEEANLCIDNLAYLTKDCSDTEGGFKACFPFERSTCLYAQDEEETSTEAEETSTVAAETRAAMFTCQCTAGLELNDEQDDCFATTDDDDDDAASSLSVSLLALASSLTVLKLWH